MNDFSESWVEHQIMAAVRGMPIPAADEIPPGLEYKLTPKAPAEKQPSPETNLNNLTVPIGSRSQSYNSDSSRPRSPHGQPSAAVNPSPSNLFRGRAKTLASLTTSSKNAQSPDMSPREFKLPHDPFVNGQPIETYLYKEGSECPICFLYYPPYLNKTRCCDQPICSECFVQIKRPDPHPPDHEGADPNAPRPEGEAESQPDRLISEPAACPFCVQPELGITYTPPPFRRGLTYSMGHGGNTFATAASPASSSSSVATGAVHSPPSEGRRRATSLSVHAPGVITTDIVRPDWAKKLAAARLDASRRSAAATALHNAAYSRNPGDQRNVGSSSRRGGMLRRAAGGSPQADSPGDRTTSPQMITLASLAERRAIADRDTHADTETDRLAPPRASSRRDRNDEIEDMMIMEAIRLSLAAEEERRKKEEKQAKKEAKQREKEAKKAEKRGGKSSLYGSNTSHASLDAQTSGPSRSRADSEPFSAVGEDTTSKGKGVDRPAPDATGQESSSKQGNSSAGSPTQEQKTTGEEPANRSPPESPSAEQSNRLHFQRLSSASSSDSSLVESALGEQLGSSAPLNGSNSSLEPLVNFQSLAGVIGDEDKTQESGEHIEGSAQGEATKEGKAAHSDPAEKGSSHDQGCLDTKEEKPHSSGELPEVSSMGTTN